MPKGKKQIAGGRGEDLAEDFLEARGYRVIARNVRTHCGEIDIIARDGRVTCFIEVKLRVHLRRGYPEEAVDTRKQRAICRAALLYAQKHRLSDTALRFDVVAILDSAAAQAPDIRLIKNAFPLMRPYMW